MQLEGVDYRVVYRRIKYPRLEFKTGLLTLILPEGADPREILEKHKDWILEKAEFISDALEKSEKVPIQEKTKKSLSELVASLVSEYSDELGVSVNRIFFRKMKTKWASCSINRNLTINTLMRYLPEELIEYVIFHEMAHMIEKTHSEGFWRLISKKFENYGEMEQKLFTYWFLVQRTLSQREIGGQ